MIAILGLLLLFGGYVALVACLDRAETRLALWRKVSVVATAGRIGLLWILLALHWRDVLGLWALPPILLLLPEGFLLPRDFPWTIGRGLMVTVILAAGTTLWTGIAVAVVRGLRGRSGPAAHQSS